ncbi:hypothetical protein SUGI_0221460 [Cryptomeria japonica]|uniref:uncharacterized protein LOC131031011 n=1 Tax=Cryptomeria japonica TaxID=3369 RepID=UPI002408A2EE|nr:uncharacterized protein LOC131031011 [Cryptomeria japonica]GLJ13860.1 hypothetical protein SUGI_0221460 [Cryptomeria japonica]
MECDRNTLRELALSIADHPPSDFNLILQFFVSSSRSDIHRKKLPVSPFLNYLSSLSEACNDEKTDSNILVCTVLKILRNLCAGEIKNQTSFVYDGGLEITASLAKQLIFQCSRNPSIERNSFCEGSDVCQMILQLLGNVCLAGEEQQSAIWRAFFPHIFAGFASIQNAKIYEPLCMVICTCCKNSQGRLKEICGNDGYPIFAGLLSTSQKVRIEANWLELLLTKICYVEPYFVHLFTGLSSLEVSSARVGDGREIFCLEQALLLYVIANFATHQMEEFSLLVNSKECKSVVREFVTFIVEIVRKSEGSIDFRSVNPPTLPTGLPAIDVLGYSLNILRDICASEDFPSSSADIHQNQENGKEYVGNSLVSSDLIQLMIDLLRELGPPEAVKKATRQASTGSSNPCSTALNQSKEMTDGSPSKIMRSTVADMCEDPSLLHDGDKDRAVHASQTGVVCPYKGYRRDIVSVLANASFRRKHVQDQIRECGGLFIILQHCVVDNENPFLREWGLWAVRNLLENNRENQKQVAELELQNSVNTSAIAEMGLRVEIDPNSRKPRLFNLAT